MGKQSGFSILEIIFAAAVVGVAFAAVAVQMKTVKSTLADTSRLMAMDSFERYVGEYLKSKDVILNSVKRSTRESLKRCFAGNGCVHGRSYEFPLYLPGEDKSMSGPNALFDEEGVSCQESTKKTSQGKKCGAFYLSTSLKVNCFDSARCKQPEIVLVRGEIRRVGETKASRVLVREMERGLGQGFGTAYLACGSAKEVLEGVTIRGRPKCVKEKDIVFIDEKAKKPGKGTFVKPKDCPAVLNDAQAFVQGIGGDGKIDCSKKFW